MHNHVQNAILGRRSIRAYTDAQLTNDQLAALIDAALASPSAMDFQPWHFTAVQNDALLVRINDASREVIMATMPQNPYLDDPDYSVFYGAPTVFFISSANPCGGVDIGIAVQNIAIAAHGLGLGSVILGLPCCAFSSSCADALRNELNFPEGYDCRIAIAVGTPATTKPAHSSDTSKVNVIK